MNQLSDEKILSGLNSEDKKERDSALKQLYASEYPVITAFVRKNSGSEEEAADIFQDAIVAFYEKVRLGNLELNCTIRTYIYSMCRHLWLNRLRAQKRLSNIDDEVKAIAIAPEAFTAITTTERNELIIQLIEKLGEDCKKVLTYYYFNRFRMREIAKQMNFANEQVAKNKKSACMKKLKNLITSFPGSINILK